MIRKIIVPTLDTITIQLPPEFIGKAVEIIAFEIVPEKNENQEKISFEDRMKGFSFNSGGYQFNREDANDYD